MKTVEEINNKIAELQKDRDSNGPSHIKALWNDAQVAILKWVTE